MGLLVVDSDGLRAFSDEHKELLERFSKIASAMLSNVVLNQQVKEQAQWVDGLYKVSDKLNQVLKVNEVLQLLKKTLGEEFSRHSVVICLCEPSTKQGKVWGVVGGDEGEEGKLFSLDNKYSVYAHALTSGKVLMIKNFDKNKEACRFEKAESSQPKEVLLAPLYDDKNKVLGCVGIESHHQGYIGTKEAEKLKSLLSTFSNGISKAQTYAELEKMATIDGLTQIPNHRKFQDFLSIELTRAKRYGDHATLLLMDIDHFKNFNDTYGHTLGDTVLKIVAAVLKREIRTTDICARYGGEEFVVVLIKSTAEEAEALAERIRQAIEEAVIEHEGKNLTVTVSIGSATYPEDSQVKMDLIEKADQAMYYSKDSGRNQVSLFHQIPVRTKAPSDRVKS